MPVDDATDFLITALTVVVVVLVCHLQLSVGDSPTIVVDCPAVVDYPARPHCVPCCVGCDIVNITVVVVDCPGVLDCPVVPDYVGTGKNHIIRDLQSLSDRDVQFTFQFAGLS